MAKNKKRTLFSLTRPDRRLFERMSVRMGYSIGFGACSIIHILYLFYFFNYGSRFMAYFNIFSSLFYFMLLYLNYRIKNRRALITAAIIEIMVHASLAIMCGGWHQGFGLFLLMIMPVPFFQQFRKLRTPYLISATSFLLFIIMCVNFSGSNNHKIYEYSSNNINNALFFFNVSIGAGLLFYVSTVYVITQDRMNRKLTAQNEKLQKLASIDPLTELFNRRAMSDYLKLIQHNCRKSGSGYVIGIGDIDNFKKINDTYGHSSGDEALRAAAANFAKNIPSEGYASRWGGEEFLFVIPNADIDKGVVISERIRLAVKDECFFSDAGSFSITITIGVFTGTAEDDIEKVISKADEQLYIGKKNGKNRTQYLS